MLFRLEPTQARANSDMLRKQPGAVLAQEARLLAELDGRPEISVPGEMLEGSMIPETALDDSRERRVRSLHVAAGIGSSGGSLIPGDVRKAEAPANCYAAGASLRRAN